MTSTTDISLPPSIYNAYFICQRQAWLMFRQLTADQHHSNIEIGRHIDDTSYEREKKKIYLADISAMVDMITKRGDEYFVAEIKKSSKRLDNAIIQLKYYLYLLRSKSVNVKGMLKIPREKKNIEVELSDEDIKAIEKNIKMIFYMIYRDSPPDRINKKICTKCAHYEFCWA